MDWPQTHLDLAYDKVAAFSGEVVYKNVLRFYCDAIFGEEINREAILQKHGVTFEEFQEAIVLIAWGINRTIGMLVQEAPYIVVTEEDEAYHDNMIRHEHGGIKIGLNLVARLIAKFHKSKYCPAIHSGDFPMSREDTFHYLGYEEGVHFQHYRADTYYMLQRQPQLCKAAKLFSHDEMEANGFTADYYTREHYEVYAGLLIRGDLRKKYSDDDEALEKLHAADLFIINRWKNDDFGNMPDFLFKLIWDVEIELRKVTAAGQKFYGLQPKIPDGYAPGKWEVEYDAKVKKRKEQSFLERMEIRGANLLYPEEWARYQQEKSQEAKRG